MQATNRIAISIQAVNIKFYHKPALAKNQILINQGQSLVITPSFLNITTEDYPPNQVNFTISNLQHAQFQLAPFNTSITQFTQQQILAGQVSLVQDGSTAAPTYSVGVSDPYFTLSPAAAAMSFYRKPILAGNSLALNQGQRVTLTSKFLNITHEDYPTNHVNLTISNLQHGQFQLSPSNTPVTQFTQQQLLANQVVFTHDTSPVAPSYQVGIADPYFTLSPQTAVITFTPLPPVFVNNQLATFQGRSTTLTLQNLQGSDPDITFNVGSLTFSVSQVRHGQFSLVADPSQPITQFTQAQISAGQIEFIQDSTPSTPSYQVLLTDGRLNIAQSADVSFDAAPVFINNRLTISPGQTVVLAITNIRVIDTNTGDSGLIFTPQNVQHGQFISLLNPGVTLTNFTQAQISDAEIEFVADGSDQAPSYTLTVVDAVGLTATENAEVVFNLSSATTNNSNTVRNAIIGAVLSGVISLGFFAFQIWVKRKAQQRFEQASAEEEGVGKQQAEFHKNVIRPIAKAILARIQITGFLGYVSELTMHDAMSAISGLVHELEHLKVNVDLQSLSSAQQHRLVDIIARQTRRILVPDHLYCSLSSFFCPEVTPNRIEENIPAIAAAIKEAWQRGENISAQEEIKELKSVETSSRINSLSRFSGPADGGEIELVSHRVNIFSEAQELSQMKSRMIGLEKQVIEHAKRLDDLESKPLLSNS